MNKTIKLYSANDQFQQLETLKHNRNKRHKTRSFLVEGVRNINQALAYNWTFKCFIYTQDANLSNWAKNILASQDATHYQLSPELQTQLSNKNNASELMAIINIPEDNLDNLKLSNLPLLIVFDRPSNPGNLGTIIRSCDALGADALIITGHAVDLYDPETIAASTGSLFALPVVRLNSHSNLLDYFQTIKERYGDLQLIGSSAQANTLLQDCNFWRPTVLFIGNETKGLSHAYKELSDTFMRIDMQGSASSLNVACATTIMLYEVQRQRAQAQP